MKRRVSKEIKKQLVNGIRDQAIIKQIDENIKALGIYVPISQIELILKLFTVAVVMHLDQGMAVSIKGFGTFSVFCQDGRYIKAGFIKKDVDVPPHYIPIFTVADLLLQSFNKLHAFGSLDLGAENQLLNKYLQQKQKGV